MSFKDKVVIVTGASSGIGAATAIAFAAEGAKVTMVGRNAAKLKNVAAKVEEKGSKPLIIVADISVKVNCRKIIYETLSAFKRVDILVNNAGIATTAGILAPNAMEVYEQTMATNLHSVVLLTHLAAPHLVQTKGNIINVSSIVAEGNILPNSFSYCVSKAGMNHFTRAIALELAPKGVRVNTVSPGPVRTDVIDKADHPLHGNGIDAALRDKIFEKIASHVPLRKVGQPEELADLIMFLASHKARSMTGGTFPSDNGAALSGLMQDPRQ